jgi:hypothetical protein
MRMGHESARVFRLLLLLGGIVLLASTPVPTVRGVAPYHSETATSTSKEALAIKSGLERGCSSASPQSFCIGSCYSNADCPCGEYCEADGTCQPSREGGFLIDGDDGRGCSPIIIALGPNANVQLTSAKAGVWFDIQGSGNRYRVAWTKPGEPVGFLVLDRNADGTIDDGTELFGNYTRLPNGQSAPNGFKALAAYDRPENGGNGDGVIDARDAIWSELQLWIDVNHNGHSEPNELHILGEYGLTQISLNYVITNRTDEHGNVFRLKARCQVAGKVRAGYDVYFTTRPPAQPAP